MNVSRHEAQETLKIIEDVAAQMRKAVAYGGAPYYMILWGAIWSLGFLSSHFLVADYQGWNWLTLVALGTAISAYLGFRTRARVRVKTEVRFMLLWVAVMLYSMIWMWIARPSSPEQASLLIVTFMMFGYVVIGLWMERVFAWVGLSVTLFGLIVYLLIPEFYNLSMAFLGGGTLMLGGFYILRRWK